MTPGSRVAIAMLLVAAAGPAGFFAYRFLAAEHLIARPARIAALDASLQSSMTRPTGIGPAGISGTTASAPSGIAPRARGEAASGAVAPSLRAASAPESAPIPQVLPDLTLPDAQGTPRRLSAWRGHPLLINFWATWCAPCRREIPLLKTLRRAATDHLEVIGIAVDDRDAVIKYAHAMGIDYPVLIGGTDGGMAAVHAFGMEAVLPFSVFADTQGRIVAVKVGELHPDDARLILGRLAEVDDGRLALQAARDQISSGLATLAAARARS